jgi:hypothetical protein
MLAGLLAGCAHRPPEPPAVPPVPAVNPSAPVVAPRRATGSYVLTTDLKRSQPAAPPRRRRAPPVPVLGLRLDFQNVAAPDATATSNTQLAALVNIPGYTLAPPGRIGQAAVWWPLPGDSVIVHFASPRGDGLMDLRGVMTADTLVGDIWFTNSSGAAFQLGTFRAVKMRR